MRLGRLRLDVRLEYVVDLDNPDMRAHAQDCLFEDVGELYKEEDLLSLIVEEPDPGLSQADIPEFLLEACEFCEENDEE